MHNNGSLDGQPTSLGWTGQTDRHQFISAIYSDARVFFHFVVFFFFSCASAFLPEQKTDNRISIPFLFLYAVVCRGAAIVLPNYDSLFEIFVVLLCYFRKGKSKLLHIIYYFGARTQHASCIYTILHRHVRSAHAQKTHTNSGTHIDTFLQLFGLDF